MIVYSLTSVMAGLGGDSRTGLQAAAAGTPTQKSIATLYAKLKQISLELENPDDGTKSDSLDDAVALEVTGKLNEVERTLGAVAAAKKPDLMAAEKKK
jgi:small-conductance mechanosensitive channel